MREASKTRAARSLEFYERYMAGSVLDIGCGDDLCVPRAVAFDKADGDANEIQAYLSPETFDCVHSSHCLEHMHQPAECIRAWWSLVKPGGVLVTVVPDEDLYEQGNWPSLFNSDHKATFRLTGTSSWSPVSLNVMEMVKNLPGVGEITARRMDNHYIYVEPLKSGIARKTARKLAHKLRRFRTYAKIDTLSGNIAVRLALAGGDPVDQTVGRALAQIEIVAEKSKSAK